MNKLLLAVLAVGALGVGIGAAELHKRWISSAEASNTDDSDFDDPAVAVCEFTHLRGRSIQESLYKRTKTTIDGTTVTISYEKAPLNTRPQKHSYSCEFQLLGEKFFLAPFTTEVADCKRIVEEFVVSDFQERAKSGGITRDELQTQIEELERCQKVLVGGIVDGLADMRSIHIPLNELGIYPFNPQDTALRP